MGKKKKWKRAFAVYATACLMGSIFPAQDVYASENTSFTETGGHDTQEETGIPENAGCSGAETAGLQESADTGQAVEQEQADADPAPGSGGTSQAQEADPVPGSGETSQAQEADPAPDQVETDGLEDDADDKGSMTDTPADDSAEPTDSQGPEEIADNGNGALADGSAEPTDSQGPEEIADNGNGALADDSAEPADSQGSEKIADNGNGTLADDSMEPGRDGEDSTDQEDKDAPADSDVPVSDGSYTDARGITYLYHVLEDGTADIYSVEEYSGKEMDIPAELDGHTVTHLTFCLRNGNFASVTIPETVTYIGGMAFGWTRIGTLRYNAAAALAEENTVPAPFSSAEIGNLLLGGNVSAIPDHMFQAAVFLQDELVITAPVVCEDAFRSAQFQKLTIGENVRSISVYAFAWTKIRELCWNAKEVSYGEGYVRNAPFIYASISGVSFGGAASSIPSCFLANAELSISGLDIPSHITSIGSCAFYDAAADGASIGRLAIGGNMDYLGGWAFYGWNIGVLEYNTADAATDGPDGSGPFQNVQVGELRIGENVTVLPAKIFCGIGLEQEELEISGSIVSVEDKAFCKSAGKNIDIGTLTIGKNVSHIGMFSFAVNSIGTLNYDAEDAGADSGGEPLGDPFSGVRAGRLNIGESVRKIPACAFFAMRLSQDVLELPSGLTHIGAMAFWTMEDGISIGRIVVRENVSYIGWAAFQSCSIGKAVVYALYGEVECKDIELEGSGLPECGSVEIHGGSDYYSYFTSNTVQEKITLMCSDFETSAGEEYYDAEKGCFVVPVTEICKECGYQKLGGEYADAFTVIFRDHDGTELARQVVHEGDDAAAPENPERTGWRFTGWDGAFTDVRSDLTITAQYEIQKYQVVFKDGGTVLSSQEVEYGSDAEIPEDPARPDEEWGKWKFTGWDGSYTNISKDETVSAVFERELNQYEVVFYDAAGNVLSIQTVLHGGKARKPQAPEKEADKRHIYIFKGWDGDTEMITGDAGFHPVYEQETRTYKVTFMNGDTVLDVQEVAYGAGASVPPEPVKETDGQYIYKFTGWDGSFSFITGDTVIRALFDAEKTGDNGDKDEDTGNDSSDKDKEEDKGDTGNDKDKEDTGNKDTEDDGNDKDEDKDKEDAGNDKDTEDDGNDKDNTEDDSSDKDKEEDKGDTGNDKDKEDTGNKDTEDDGNGKDEDKDKEDAGNDKNTEDDSNDKDKEEDKGDAGNDKDKEDTGNKEDGSGTDKDNDKDTEDDGNDKDTEDDGSDTDEDGGDKEDTGSSAGDDSSGAGSDPDDDKGNAGNNKDENGSGTDDHDGSDNGDRPDKDKDGNGNGGNVPGKENNGNPVSDGNGKKEPETDADSPGTGNQTPVTAEGSGTGTQQEPSGQTQDKTRGTLRIVNAAAGTGRKLDGAVFAVYDSSGFG